MAKIELPIFVLVLNFSRIFFCKFGPDLVQKHF